MRLLITGICGFAGFSLTENLLASIEGLEITGLDNLMRPGSERNRVRLRETGIRVVHGDVRCASDFETLPDTDWLLDAAANPSVMAGVDGRTGSRQTVEHNLGGTVNMLEYCRRVNAGFILLSTSRVYSIKRLTALSFGDDGYRFVLKTDQRLPPGVSMEGVTEKFSTTAPVSLYGTTKRCSEALALEYGSAFGFPVRINRCGVLAGAGQFGTAEQGIFSYWPHAWQAGKPLRYIGFDGMGKQIRDALHPADLAQLIAMQLRKPDHAAPRILNAAGGFTRSMSLRELSMSCSFHFGERDVESDLRPRPFDLPWLVLDCAAALRSWGWEPQRSLESILEEIYAHVLAHPGWLDLTAP